MGQEDYRWDRGTRDGNSETRGGTDGPGGPEVGHDYYRWDGGGTVRPGVRQRDQKGGHRDQG